MQHRIHFYWTTQCVATVQCDELGVLVDKWSVWVTLSKHPADDKAPACSSDLFLDRNTFCFYWDNAHANICKHTQFTTIPGYTARQGAGPV